MIMLQSYRFEVDRDFWHTLYRKVEQSFLNTERQNMIWENGLGMAITNSNLKQQIFHDDVKMHIQNDA